MADSFPRDKPQQEPTFGGAHHLPVQGETVPVGPDMRQLQKSIDEDDAKRRANQSANEARAAGKKEKAEKLYAKCQYWLDKMNKALGRG